jgi:hypothetical protein
MLAAHVKELSAQQELLYASNSYALLLIFQQAIRWLIEPAGFKSPNRTIQLGLCRPTGIQQDSRDYLADIHLGLSSSTHVHAD